jgi:hypothetical protein
VQRAVTDTEDGRLMRSPGFSAFTVMRRFFGGLYQSWFAAALDICAVIKPDLLVLTIWPVLSGQAAIPALLGLDDTTVVVANTIPLHPTSDFSPPVTGQGFTAPFGFLNR